MINNSLKSALIVLTLLISLISVPNAQADCWQCPCPERPYTYQTESECTFGCPVGLICAFYSYCNYLASDPACLPADYYEFLHCNGEGYSGSNNEYDDFYCIQPDNLCEGQVGGPVNLADGSAWYRPEPDISLNNPFPLEIRHAYWSMASLRDHSSTEPPPLGWGWRINFYEWLKIDGSESNLVGIRRWTGAIDRFSIRANSPWIPEDGKREKLVQGNNYFELTDAEGISRIYRGTGRVM